MCGRFAQVIKHNYLKKYLDELANPELTIPINFNVSPTQQACTIFSDSNKIIQDFMQWKLVPAWANDSSPYNIINTRLESITEKAVWRGLFRHKRCLIPVNGFYEWHKKTKQPYFIKSEDAELMFLAGIYDIKEFADGSLLPSFSILTKEANEQVSELHHRMPIILPYNQLEDYIINPNYQEVLTNCYTQKEKMLRIYPVSKAVNKTSNNYPELVNEYIIEDNLTLF